MNKSNPAVQTKNQVCTHLDELHLAVLQEVNLNQMKLQTRLQDR